MIIWTVIPSFTAIFYCFPQTNLLWLGKKPLVFKIIIYSLYSYHLFPYLCPPKNKGQECLQFNN